MREEIITFMKSVAETISGTVWVLDGLKVGFITANQNTCGCRRKSLRFRKQKKMKISKPSKQCCDA